MKRPLLDQLNALRAARRPAALVTELTGGRQALLADGTLQAGDLPLDAATLAAAEASLAADRSGLLEAAPDLFLQAFHPLHRMIVVGAVHIAQALLPMARLAGYEVILVDPRKVWGSAERFPGEAVDTRWPDEALAAIGLDRRCALVLLSHDPKLDDPALTVGLPSAAFYIGALGSRKTHAKRLARLREAGFDEAALARIHAPIGLPLGGRSPAEIAVSVLAQVTQVRHAARQSTVRPPIAALVLAAGRSSRMGGANKLLSPLDGRPMIVRTVEAVAASHAAPVVVVTGHQQAELRAALTGRRVIFAENPGPDAGLSASLRAGLTALPAEAAGALVCLGDMPFVDAPVIEALIAAFDPAQGRAICLPSFQGRRGHPVLFARRFFPEIAALTGDAGARAVIEAHPEAVLEVPVAHDGILRDIDTPEALAAVNAGG